MSQLNSETKWTGWFSITPLALCALWWILQLTPESPHHRVGLNIKSLKHSFCHMRRVWLTSQSPGSWRVSVMECTSVTQGVLSILQAQQCCNINPVWIMLTLEYTVLIYVYYIYTVFTIHVPTGVLVAFIQSHQSCETYAEAEFSLCCWAWERQQDVFDTFRIYSFPLSRCASYIVSAMCSPFRPSYSKLCQVC